MPDIENLNNIHLNKNDISPNSNADMCNNQSDSQQESSTNNCNNNRGKKRKCKWFKRAIKTLFILIACIIIIPILLYIPPVQRFAIDCASDFINKSTGMQVGIGEFRLSFPIDVHLKNVYVVEASGDTMVRAREAIADIKLLPLLNLDVKIKRLRLNDGYYRMLAADSSMIVAVNAGYLEVDDKSSANIAASEIILNKAKLRDGSLSLFMDVWKAKPTPEDSTTNSTPFLIRANDLSLDNFTFAMSMLPTIDTMNVALKHVALKQTIIDLRENLVRWQLAKISGGDVTYLTPTAEYIKTHPAPPSQPSSGPPMRIMGDSIAVDSLTALYAVKDAKPLDGFDASYLKVDGVALSMKDFYNEASSIRLPITRLQARERSGLQITQGSGTVAVDSVGLALDNFVVKTLFSSLSADADVPFAMMALEPSADMFVKADGRLGLPDVEAFMPAMKQMLANVPARKPIDFALDASGSLANLIVDDLSVEMPGVISLGAKGFAKNPLDYKKMVAKLSFNGSLINPAVANKFVAMEDMSVPAFTIEGSAEANGLNYGADFSMRSDAGNLVGNGHVAMTPENYTADISAVDINVAQFVPSLGVGRVSADIYANGHGFNPLSGKAVTDAMINISSIEYNNQLLRDIRLDAKISDAGDLFLKANSANPGLDFDLNGSGTILPDDYVFDVVATLRDVNLQKLGLYDSICYGSGDIALRGSAHPSKWIYDVDVDLSAVEWVLGNNYIHLPDGMVANLHANEQQTQLKVNSLLTTLDFESPSGLEKIIDAFSAAGANISKQVDEKSVAVGQLVELLPDFSLNVDAAGRGLLSQFLKPSDMALDTLHLSLAKDSLLVGDVKALNFASPSINLDTMTLTLKQRGELLDYRAYIGNRPGTLDEFAKLNLNGYIGANRMSAYLKQWNIQGKQGYKIGLTAALQDSVVSAHITPLKSTIAYLPWTFNNDNFVDFNLVTKKVVANLNARNAESSILAMTQQNEAGKEELYVDIDNLHIEDFLNMFALAPRIKGDLNTDLHVIYEDNRFSGKGSVGLQNFVYEKTMVGNFDLDLDAGYGFDSSTDVKAALRINGEPAMAAYAKLVPDGAALKPDTIGLSLTRFPLKIANPFLDNSLVLSGVINGDMHMQGTFAKPILNGVIAFDSVSARIPMFDATLRFGKDRLDVVDNVVDVRDFEILGANANPIVINGYVDASKFSNMVFDLSANANNFQLINSTSRSKGDLYGKIFLNLGATVKGPMKRLDVNGNVNLLGTTDATYRLNMSPAELQAQSSDDIVKFVNFNDTTSTNETDSIEKSALNMRVNANLTISPGTQLAVLLSSSGSNKVIVSPSANLNYYQNYMGDMSLTGTLTLGDGYARYAVPVIGEKMFTFVPTSTITWNGPIANPVLNVTATDNVRANVNDGSGSRLCNFLVTLKATNTVDNMVVNFDLSTNDDLTIQNELQSMSADQRQTQAMNLFLYGKYTGQSTKTNQNANNILYSFLESQINSWAAKNIKGVDLSFGMNQYDKTSDGVTNTETSYSYQVSKTLFNNKFKIQVGGNYSTDTADDDIAENLVSDVSLEYIIRQSSTTNMSVKLFRHIGFESILEGEITEMGAGFVFKRHLETLKNIFKFRKHKKKKESSTPVSTDSIVAPADSNLKKNEHEKI